MSSFKGTLQFRHKILALTYLVALLFLNRKNIAIPTIMTAAMIPPTTGRLIGDDVLAVVVVGSEDVTGGAVAVVGGDEVVVGGTVVVV